MTHPTALGRFSVTILGIKRGDDLIVNLTDDTIVEHGDVLIVFGETEAP